MSARMAVGLLAGLVLAGGAGAQCVAAGGQVDYRVRPGDTLAAIARRYMVVESDWPVLQRINHVASTTRLAPGSTLRLPLQGLRRSALGAQISFARGDTVLLREGAAPQALAAGDQVAEGSVLRVGKDSYLSVQLADKSLLQIEADSEVRLAGLCQALDGRVRVSLVRLNRGRVESTVAPQAPGSRFEVSSPLAVAAVRGTRFGVELRPAGEHTDVIDGTVRVAPVGARLAVAAARGQGVRLSGAPARAVLSRLPEAPDLSVVPPIQLSTVLYLPVAAVPGTRRYRFRIASDAQFARTLIASTAERLPIRVAGLPSGVYYVAVRAEDADGMPGKEGVRRIDLRADPAPPLLRAPVPGASVMGPAVAFSCTETAAVAAYRMELSGDALFAAPRAVPAGASCGFQLDDLAPGAYHWRAASLERVPGGALVQGPWGEAQGFTVVPPLPQPGLRLPPPEDGVVDVTLEGGRGNRFLLQVASDPAFLELLRDSEEDQAHVTLRLAGGASYFLRVQLINAYGWRSAFSPVQRVDLPLLWRSGTDGALFDGRGRAVGRQQ